MMLTAYQEFEKAWELRGWYDCYNRAGIQSMLGNNEKALSFLRDCKLHAAMDHYILIDPLFQNLWENEEFQEIIRQRHKEKSVIRERMKSNALKG